MGMFQAWVQQIKCLFYTCIGEISRLSYIVPDRLVEAGACSLPRVITPCPVTAAELERCSTSIVGPWL